MTPDDRPLSRRPASFRRLRLSTTLGAAVVAVTTTAILAGFHTELRPVTPAEEGGTRSELVTTDIVGIRTFTPPPGITVDSDVVYGTQADGALLTLDVCSPPADAARAADVEPSLRPAVISIHGGSWARGDKANSDWRGVCQWLASAGFVAYSVNYRLAPAAQFPAAIDDLTVAVEWIREADNVRKYGIDPDRIGVLGGSAGGNLAALLGARGTGSLAEGSRVAAVATLSAPTDLRHESLRRADAPEGLHRIVLSYLGCSVRRDCEAEDAASPITELDVSDPPVFIGASTGEFIPLSQSTGYASRLAELDIPHQLVTVPGSLHSIGILDEAMRTSVADFLHSHLSSPAS
ncbi:MAG TPA: alpha/beta hydrolase [Glaciibacter sp.]|nr:alpha/beta hydrolase [Glaciibacter sp.]